MFKQKVWGSMGVTLHLIQPKLIELDKDKCIDCGACFSICPVSAISIAEDFTIETDLLFEGIETTVPSVSDSSVQLDSYLGIHGAMFCNQENRYSIICCSTFECWLCSGYDGSHGRDYLAGNDSVLSVS